MLLEKIRKFSWLNEPENVEFIEKGLLIRAKSHTDFWQNTGFNISKDDGHFFADTKDGDFILITKWSFEKIVASAQCGVMIKSDTKNWIKAGILSNSADKAQIGAVTACNGACDWSEHDLDIAVKTIFFAIKRKGANFIVFYSLDGIDYKQIRLINHPNIRQVIDVGAYACSPGDEAFECILEEIDIKK